MPEQLYRALEWDGTPLALFALALLCLLATNVIFWRTLRKQGGRIEGATVKATKAYRRAKRLQRNSERTTLVIDDNKPDSSAP
jgi:hypothetical protein